MSANIIVNPPPEAPPSTNPVQQPMPTPTPTLNEPTPDTSTTTPRPSFFVRSRSTNTNSKTNTVGVQVENTRICVVMVGLPARGKSLIAQKGRYPLLKQPSLNIRYYEC